MSKIMDIPEQITYSTVLVHCFTEQISFGRGTGFIVDLHPGKDENSYIPFLVTNKHVVGVYKNTTIELCKKDENGDPIDTQTISITFDNSLWIHHPDPSVDICCVRLDCILRDNQLEDQVFFCSLQTELIPTEKVLNSLFAFEEVIMIGYPTGFSDNHNHKPIVRRGITASHPNKDYQGKKDTLLDIAIFPGSSGSPVFIYNSCVYSTKEGNFVGGPRILLLGIVYNEYCFDEKKQVEVIEIPAVQTLAYTEHTHLNLAVMIKSEKILDFEKMLQDGTL